MARALLSRLRVGVVGAGVIGLSCARELLARGAEVTLFEADRAGRGAGWASAGMLAAAAETLEDDAARAADLARKSLALWPAFAAALERAGGRAIGFRQDGALLVALDADHELRLRDWAARARGHELRPLGGEEARALEPGLSSDVRFALLAPRDWAVDSRAVLAALRTAVGSVGGAIREGAEVTDVRPGSPVLIAGRGGEGGFTHEADVGVIAAGWRAGQLSAAAPALAGVHPFKGQMLAVDAGASAPRRVIRGRDVYLVPRSGGRVLIGATSEPDVASPDVDAAAIAALRRAAVVLLPALADAPIVETWSGVRPGLHGGGPLIAEVAPGLIAAVGHHRNGMLLAPGTAVRVADLVAAAAEARAG